VCGVCRLGGCGPCKGVGARRARKGGRAKRECRWSGILEQVASVGVSSRGGVLRQPETRGGPAGLDEAGVVGGGGFLLEFVRTAAQRQPQSTTNEAHNQHIHTHTHTHHSPSYSHYTTYYDD
jgi:hypothetical protein